MARFEDYTVDQEVQDIMQAFLERYADTQIFDGFEIEMLHFIRTLGKKSKYPIKLHKVAYPFDVYVGKPYIVNTYNELWQEMEEKQKHIAVFHIMCSFPVNAFYPESENYGKVAKPDIEMHTLEYAACGGPTDWWDSNIVKDPMTVNTNDVVKAMGADDIDPNTRKPVTVSGV